MCRVPAVLIRKYYGYRGQKADSRTGQSAGTFFVLIKQEKGDIII